MYQKHIISFIGILFVFLIGCDSAVSSKLSVLSTTGMIGDIVKNIAQDKLNHEILMGPGVDPHLYKASEGDVQKLANADIIFYNGMHLESKLADEFERMATKKPTVAITKSIPKHLLIASSDYENYPDPHVWFDIDLWKFCVKEVTQSLIKLDTNNADFYLANQNSYLKKLSNLQKWTFNEIAKIEKQKRILITAHDAFGYFGKAYDFEVMGLQGISTVSEAGTKDIQRLTKVIMTHQIPSIFIESSVPVRQIEALQDAVNAKGFSIEIGKSLYSDAMGDPSTIEGTYIGMIKHNITSIVDGLLKVND